MIYKISLWRVINTNTGDSTIVYLTNDHTDYMNHLDKLIQVFRDNNSFVKVSIYESHAVRTAYIEYDLTKINVKPED